MKLTRADAREILEVEEDAELSIVKKAFYRKSKEWHPDKVTEEKKEEATIKFQRINAASQRLIDPESDDEEGVADYYDSAEEGFGQGPGGIPLEVLFEFFQYMEAEEHAQQERHRARGGRRPRGGGGGGPTVGGMFGGPGAFGIPLGGGTYIFMGPPGGGPGGPGGFGPFMGHDSYGPGSGGGGGGRGRGGGPRYNSRRRVQEEESDDDDISISSVDSDDLEYEFQQERMFMRMKYEEENRRRREAEACDMRWLAQLARPARISFSDTSISLHVDRGKQSRMSDFVTTGVLPACFVWQLQYRTIIPSQPPAPGRPWTARLGKREEASPHRKEKEEKEGVDEEQGMTARFGPWSAEATYNTSGVAPVRGNAAAAAEAAEAAAAAAQAKRTARKAKAAERQEAARKPAEDGAATERRRAAEEERRRAEEQKGKEQKAAMARAAAEYEKEVEAAKRQAERHVAEKAAAAAPQRQGSVGGGLSRTGSAAGSKSGTVLAAVGSPAPALRRGTSGVSTDAANTSTATAVSAACKPGAGGSSSNLAPAAAPAPVPARAPSAQASSAPPEFQLPAGYRAPKPPPAAAQRVGQTAIPESEMCWQVHPPCVRPPSASRLWAARHGMAAASGSVGASGALAREAAAHGMSVEQYRAYQDDLTLQKAIQMSLALKESRKMAEKSYHAPKVEDTARFPTLAPQHATTQPQQAAPLPVPPPLGPRPGSGGALPAAAPPADARGPTPPGGGRGGRSGPGRGPAPAAAPAVRPAPQPAAPSPLPARFSPASGNGGKPAGLAEEERSGRRVRSGFGAYQPPASFSRPGGASPVPPPVPLAGAGSSGANGSAVAPAAEAAASGHVARPKKVRPGRGKAKGGRGGATASVTPEEGEPAGIGRDDVSSPDGDAATAPVGGPAGGAPVGYASYEAQQAPPQYGGPPAARRTAAAHGYAAIESGSYGLSSAGGGNNASSSTLAPLPPHLALGQQAAGGYRPQPAVQGYYVAVPVPPQAMYPGGQQYQPPTYPQQPVSVQYREGGYPQGQYSDTQQQYGQQYQEPYSQQQPYAQQYSQQQPLYGQQQQSYAGHAPQQSYQPPPPPPPPPLPQQQQQGESAALMALKVSPENAPYGVASGAAYGDRQPQLASGGPSYNYAPPASGSQDGCSTQPTTPASQLPPQAPLPGGGYRPLLFGGGGRPGNAGAYRPPMQPLTGSNSGASGSSSAKPEGVTAAMPHLFPGAPPGAAPK